MIRDHLKIIQKTPEQHIVKVESYGTTENSHVGHCKHTSLSTRYKIFKVGSNSTLP